MAEAIEKAKKVKFVIFDIHGILTDNTLFYTQEGVKSEAFSLHDQLGLKALMDSGIGVSFLTSKVARDVEQMAKIYGMSRRHALGKLGKDGETRRVRKGSRATRTRTSVTSVTR